MIQPPFVVVEKNGDVSIYRHSADLVRDLEPIDVRNGEYEIYDRSGAVVVPMVDSVLVQSRPLFPRWRPAPRGGGAPALA